MTRSLFLRPRAVLLALALATSGCHGSSSSAGRSTLRIGVGSSWPDLTPASGATYEGAQFALLVFEGLTVLDEDGVVRPGLARSWQVADDARRWTFHLRTGVRFHDGTPFTAGDIRRSWEHHLHAAVPAGVAPWMLEPVVGAVAFAEGRAEGLRGVTVLDDSTLQVRLVRSMAHFPAMLAVSQAAIIGVGSADTTPIGTGPWQYLEGHPHAGSVTLVRNPDYWGRAPQMDTLVLAVLPDSLSQRSLERGAIDYTSGVVPGTRVALATNPHVGYVTSPHVLLTRVVFDTRRPVFQDVRVRRAFNHAVDVAGLLRATRSEGTPAAGVIPPTWPGGEAHRQPYAYDPALAVRLLREAGFPMDTPLVLVAQGWDHGTYPARQLGRLLRDYWTAVGLHVTVRDHDAPWEALGAGEADLALFGWAPDYYDADAFLYPLFYSETAATAPNPGGWRDPALDRLIDAERAAAGAERLALLARADERVFDQAASVFLWFGGVSAAYSLDHEGFRATTFVPRFLDVRPATP